MKKMFGIYTVFGLFIGAVFGTAFGPAIGNISLATGLGALGGLFIGWFVAVAVLEKKQGQ
jgi:hypothetical protein